MSDGILSRQIDLWTMIGCETELSKILPAVVSFMEAELPELAAAVFLCDARSGQLRLICASALPDEWVSRLAERPYTASAEPAMRAVANNEEVFVHDLAATAPASEETNDRGLAEIRRAWALPLREYSGSVLGALAVYGRKPGLPGMAERKALEAAAQIVAAALMAHRRKEFEIAHIEQLRRIYDNVNDVLFSVAIAPDGEYYFESANSRFFEATGLTSDQVVGKPVSQVIPEPSRAVVMQRYELAIRERRTVRWEETTPYPTGLKTGEVCVSPVHDSDGRCTRLIGSVHDVTMHKRMQKRLRRIADLYAATSQCNEVITQCTVEEELFARVCEIAVRHGGMSLAWIGVLDEPQQILRPMASHGKGARYLDGIAVSVNSGVPEGMGPSGTAFRENRAVWCQDFLADPSLSAWHDRGRESGWRSSAALPLTCKGNLMGVFSLYCEEVGAFDEEVQRLLTEMAVDISFGLGWIHDLREREQARAQLEKLSRVVAQSHNMVMILNTDARIEYVNPALERITGYLGGELAGKRESILMSPQTPPSTYAEIRSRLMRGESWKGELVSRKKDGTDFICVVHVSPMRSSDGKVTNYLGIGDDITAHRHAEWRIEYLANFDELTGLPNRTLLGQRFNDAIKGRKGNGRRLALLLFDLDRFKDINDTLGHAYGDSLLKEVAARLQDVLGENDAACRLGGDEFIVMLADADEQRAADLSRMLLRSLESPCRVGEHEFIVSASIGIAMYPEDGVDLATLSMNADMAMYQAKRGGRGCYKPYTKHMQLHTTRRMDIIRALRRAVSEDGLELHYQPQVRGRTVIGAEALLRWSHPVLGIVPPAEFIPVAEEAGLIAAVGTWVLRKAVSQAKAWMDSGIAPFVIAVNVSPVQFRNSEFYDTVVESLERCGLPSGSLELELTEGAAMHDPEGAIRLLDALHGLGVRIAIDDFGVGYSSLNYLRRLKIHRLKIDQSFVRDIGRDEQARTIVGTIVGMAKSLRLEVMAEGVETREQMDCLNMEGCELAQGYLFSRPLPASEFAAFWRSRRIA